MMRRMAAAAVSGMAAGRSSLAHAAAAGDGDRGAAAEGANDDVAIAEACHHGTTGAQRNPPQH